MTQQEYINKRLNLQTSSAPVDVKEKAIQELDRKWEEVVSAKRALAEFNESLDVEDLPSSFK